MDTLAELKRRMTVGRIPHIVNHRFPALSGDREILKAQTQRWCTEVPPDHPHHGKGGSWMDIPKASDCTFDGDTVHITRDGVRFCSITIAAAQ